MMDPLLFLSHCCGKDLRQTAGEPGHMRSLFPDFIEVCAFACRGTGTGIAS